MRRLLLLYMGVCLGCAAFAGPGTPCRKHEQCAGLPRGYCARAEICTRECTESEPCPESSACSAQGNRSVCLPKCEGNTDCLKGFSCAGGVCVVTAPLEPSPD